MSETSLPASNVSLEDCNHLSYAAWQPGYLTGGVHHNLIAVICINSISAIAAILSNALVVAVIATKQQLRTLYNILLACMGATDLLVGMLVQPLFVVSEIKHLNGFAPFCALDTVVSVTSYGFCLASVGHLVLISVERFVFIKLPLRYEEIATENRMIVGVLTVWVVSASFSITMIMMASRNELVENQPLLTIFELLTAFIVFVYIAVIVYTCVVVLLESQRQKRRMQTHQLSAEETQQLRKNHKAAYTFTIIVTGLLFSYMPTLVLNIYAAISNDWVEPHLLYVISSWSFTSVLLGSLLNPLIYFWRIATLRRAFLDFMHIGTVRPQQDNQPHLSREAWSVANTN